MRSIFILLVATIVSLITSCTPNIEQDTPIYNTPPREFNNVIPLPTNSTPPIQASKYGGVLTLANRGDPPAGFDPSRTSSIALHHVGGALFGPGNLVMRCREDFYKICPNIAKKWIVNQSYKEWTFTLQDDIYWHDQRKFTPEDVQFWFQLSYYGIESKQKYRPPAYFKSELGNIKSVDILGHDRIRVILNETNPYFLDILANPRFKLAHPKHLVSESIADGNVSISPIEIGLIGLGPFKLEKYDKGSLISLSRWDKYWEESEGNNLPYLDNIDYVIMPNPFTMDVAFRTGKLDGGARGRAHYLTSERKAGYVKDLGEDVFFAETDGGNFRLAFNILKEGPWQDPSVRRAISLWIDKPSSIDTVLGGFGWTTPDLNPPTILMPIGRANLINWPKFDLEPLDQKRDKAKSLITKAGYPNGFSMGHLCRSINPRPCEYLKSQLGGLGIDLTLNMVEEGQWNNARGSIYYDTQQGRLTPSTIPEGTESVYGRYSQNPDAYAKHEDQKVDQMYRLLRNSLSTPRRVELWRAIEEYLYVEQTYIIPIAESINVVPYRSFIKNLDIPPEDSHTYTDFTKVWIGPD